MSDPKILVLDIENSYIIGGVWGLWGVNLGIDQILDAGKVLCFASKWLGKKDITYVKHDEVHFLETIHALLDEADMVLTFNGRKHDIPLLNREFLKAGMKPPSPYKHIDLLETAKKQFKFPSNKMQHLLTELGLPNKLDHEGFKLWIKCLEDDPVAWAIMKKYNIQDVKVLEKLYNKILPWIVNHPNRSMYSNSTVCPNCGGKHLTSRGYYRTQVGLYRRLVCGDCGHWSRTRFTETDKETRKNIVVSAA